MGSSYFAHRVSTGEIPTRITLPNVPLNFGRRKGLTLLVPIYVEPYGSKPEESQTKVYFVDMAIAIQDSRNEWLEKILTEYIGEIPLRDEANGITLLHIAAKSSNESTLNILLKHDGILQLLNEADFRGTTPLIVAAWYGNFAALKYLLALGCETMSYIKDTRKNALHCAADLTDTDICSQLLKYNSKKSFIDATDDEGYTPLMIAVRGGSPCVTILIMSGADYHYQCVMTGRNILHLAIVFFQNDTLLKLLRALNDSKFISAVDYNGDTPFMLAIRLQNYASIKILINNIPIKKLLNNCNNCIHYLIKNDQSDLLAVLLTTAKHIDFLEWTDSKGRTPLMYAVEIQRTDYIKEILLRQKKIWQKNPLNGETILHLAAYTNNAEIIKELLNVKGVDEIMDVCDFGGRTAYEIILSRANQACYYAFKESGYVIPEFFNLQKESSLFIAAKLGNYSLVLNLLLSENFLSFHNKFPDFTRSELVCAELQGRIYSSDTFIISGKTLNLHAWNRVPNQDHLFQHNTEDKNIFHACVMGGDIMCLAFIYTYCVHFNQNWQELDLPDREGTTPLLYATITGETDICKFFIHHGANITTANLMGEFPLLKIKEHAKVHRELLYDTITECVIEDTSKRRYGMSAGVITVSYYIFCPPGVRQLFVVSKIFGVLQGEQFFDILDHPVLQYFIEMKWVKLKYIIGIRLYVNLLTVLFTYMDMSVTLWSYPKPLFLAPIIRLPTLILSIVSIFINIPHLFITSLSWVRRIFSITILTSPLCTICYLYMEADTSRKLAVGAVAVLTAGISTFIHAIDTFLSHQISMFFEVLSCIISYLPLSFLLLLSFSFCFFVLYHDSFNFNNPAHSFLFTVMALLEGDTSSLPLFQQDNSNITFNSLEDANKNSSSIMETLPISIVEGFLQILFKILVSLSLLNMLIGLSVKGAGELEKSGNIQTLKTKVDVLHEWESFSYCKFYNLLSKYNLHFIFGLTPNLKHVLEIAPVLYLHENPLKSFDTNKLQNIAVKQDELTTIHIRFLAEDIGYRPGYHNPFL